MPRETKTPAQSGLYSERVIPDVPRLRSRRAGRFQAPPLLIYAAFVSASLILLGGMAVASLPT